MPLQPDFLVGLALGFGGGVTVGLCLDQLVNRIVEWYLPRVRLLEARRTRRRHGS